MRPARPHTPHALRRHISCATLARWLAMLGRQVEFKRAACAPRLCYLSALPTYLIYSVYRRKKLIGYLVAMAVMTLAFTQLSPHGSAI
eukprot:COSAG06_NODE_31455_length_521_cov_1.033175_1_plen_88_part_00